jgi:hypothetical protein
MLQIGVYPGGFAQSIRRGAGDFPNLGSAQLLPQVEYETANTAPGNSTQPTFGAMSVDGVARLPCSIQTSKISLSRLQRESLKV